MEDPQDHGPAHDTAAAFPLDRPFPELFAARAAREPRALAVRLGAEALTCGELDARADRLAWRLLAAGVRPEEPVAVWCERGPGLMTALLAVLKAGAVYLPLDPRHPAARRRQVLEQSGARLAVASAGFLEACRAGVPESVRVLPLADSGAPAPQGPPPGPVSTSALAYLLFTSGSTGAPKGATVTHRGMLNHLFTRVAGLGLTAADRVAQTAAQTFDISVWQHLAALLAGGSVEVFPDEVVRDPLRLLREADRAGVTVLQVVPSLLAAMVQGLERTAERPALARLRRLTSIGEALPPGLVRGWLALYPAVPIVNGYGPTECSDEVSHWEMREPPPEGAAITPIGHPAENNTLHVLEPDLRPVPLGVAGELWIGGVQVGRGYWGRPDLTAERFLPDPWSREAGGRLYRTGDLARRRTDGALEFLGRLDHQVKVRGFRIELGEVEAALASHPAVAEAVVLARDAGGERRLVAYVVARDGAALDAEEIWIHLAERLPEYMVPAALVPLDRLPLNANGKVDRKALANLAEPPLRAAAEAEAVGPRTPLETFLAGLWRRGVDEEGEGVSIGIHDSFFSLGGTSITGAILINRVQEALGEDLPVVALFEHPTVAGLAAWLEREHPEAVARVTGGAAAEEEPREAAEIVPASPEGAPLPLSFAQERLWFLDQLDPGAPAYNVPAALRLAGRLDRWALARALAEIARRHAALRTTFGADAGRPFQVIAPAAPPAPLPRVDLRGLPAEAREAEARRLAAAEALRPFDLARGPLLRVTLVQLGEEEHAALVTLHHVVSDGWSLGVLVEEMGALYGAFAAGRPSPLPEPEIQYADFAAWQRRRFAEGVLEREVDYWRRTLAGVPPLELPADRPRPALRTSRAGLQPLHLPAPLASRLAALGRAAGTTPFTVLLAAFAALLARYSGQDDVAVGSPVANRGRAELEGLIGFFVNTLVMRLDVSTETSGGGEGTFRDLLGRARETARGAFAHQEVPFERIVDALGVERDLSRTPVFQVLFALQNAPLGPLRLPGLEISPLPVEAGAAKVDLELALAEAQGDGGLAGTFQYSADLFDAATVARLAGHFRNLLEGIAEGPERRLAELPLLSAAETAELLSGAAEALPAELPVHLQIAARAALAPRNTAVVFEGRRLTYGELDARANAVAHRLRALGVGPESVVALCLDRSPELAVGLLGIWKAGGAFLPLDPDYPAERLELLLADSGARAAVTREVFAGRLPAGVPAVTTEELPPDGEPAPPAVEVSPETLAYVLYTSGSTGRPKGVMVEHGNLAGLMAATRRELAWDAADVMPCLARFSFDIFLFELLSPLLAGGASIIVRLDPVPDLEQVVALLEETTRLHAVPALMRQIVDWARLRGTAARRLRTVFVGGDSVPVELLRDLREVFPRAETRVLYGPTEGTVLATSHRVPPGTERPERTLIGRPFPGMKAVLRDRAGNLVPPGVAGEILLGGVGVARGYLGREDLTRERFVEWQGERWYRTGDLARRTAGGELEFLGRGDEQVKVRGFRVEPGEVEALLSEHPAVRESAVVAHGAAGDRRLVAYVVGEGIEAGELRAFLRGRLPEHMVPAAFVPLEALPLTPHGKVDRRALAAREVEGNRAAAPAASAAPAAPAAPDTAAEALLARIWAAVLGRESVGVHDNFFELGGDSILSIQIVAQANQAGLRITPRQLFEHQTVAALAAVAGTAEAGVAEQGPVVGPVPLTPVQRRFLAADPVAPHHFNQSVMLRVLEGIDAGTAARGFAALLAHHDALRLRFRRADGGWLQEGAPAAGEAPFARLDLTALAPAAARAALAAAAEAAQASLDLAAGPVARAVWADLPGDDPRLLLAVHHLAVDGVSWRILLADLESACRRLSVGEAPALPPKTTSFRQWAERLREHARTMPLEPELGAWLAAAAAPPLPLLASSDVLGNKPGTVAAARTVTVELGAEETRALLEEVPQAYHTRIDDALLAALARTLAGPEGVLGVELEGHGREELDALAGVDLSRTVGWFTAVYPVLLSLPLGGGPGDDLRAVKERLRAVPSRGLGYGLLRWLREGEEPGLAALRSAPSPDVSFNYLGQLDQALPAGSLFAPAAEPAGPARDPRQRREHTLELDGWVAGGRLRVDWTYGEGALDRATVERWAGDFAARLRALVDHCRSPEAGGYTPSDFDKVDLRQEDLDNLLAELDEVLD